MEKPFILIQGPVATRSGYGSHARDLCIELLKSDKYDIKIVSRRWGNTPMNALRNDVEDHKLIIDNLQVGNNLPKQPDLHIDITVPNEFQAIGKKNMGITAGLEATVIPKHWVDGLNRMDKIVVPSKFVKDVCASTTFDEKQGDKVVAQHKCNKPIDVLFEGYDEAVYGMTNEYSKALVDEMKQIDETFCFLFVGHWLQGNMGEDRKDVGMMIKAFLEAFKGKKKKPALILKTSSATFSVMDRMEILDKIEFVKRDVGGDIPNIYLLHGDLEDSEMNELYNHPKVKAHVSFTHGEGFGRPLLEASLSGKPILFSKWSGHIDFLPATLSTALDGTMVGVPKASFPKDMFVDGMGWFAVNYGKAINLMKDVYGSYNKYKPIFQHLGKSNTHKFTRSKMGEKFVKIVDEMIAGTPKQVNIKLPKLKKIDGGQTGAIKPPTGLPKLKKA